MSDATDESYRFREYSGGCQCGAVQLVIAIMTVQRQ